jgi:putative Mg2+ transporter-C (MgtC) family protein
MADQWWVLQDLALKLVLAALIGGIIGLEREVADKPAGVRTNALICLGSSLIMIVSIYVQQNYGTQVADPARIAAHVIAGIGFIGAGVILRSRGSVRGLTTAATIWAVAGIGLAIGCGFYAAALMSAFIILVILLVIGRIEKITTKKENK